MWTSMTFVTFGKSESQACSAIMARVRTLPGCRIMYSRMRNSFFGRNNLICAAPDPAARWVERHTPTLQDYRHGFGWSSVERPKSRRQLYKRKWLDQVIVGPRVKPCYPIADCVARGE